ncbi:MAG: MFS transporter [Verrucomicrobia bacterium]|nr:MFS transporter [Verrucomicrobiota bacterium]
MNSLASKTTGYAWAVVALLWPVAMLNYLDRQMVSTIRASIRADIPSIANDAQFGMLMAIFMWVYAFLSPVGGYIADKFNRRWTVIGSLFVWSAVTWLTGHANTYGEMKFYRALMGISEAFYIPAALALIADFHPGNTRARAVGIHQTGIYAGLALGGIGGYIAQMSTWRNCFTWFGAAGVAYAVVLMLALRDAPSANGEAGKNRRPITIGDTLRALWTQPAFWILVMYFTLPAIGGWVTKNWLPTFLADTFKLKEGPAGLSATGYIQIASFAGVLLGGTLADYWMRVTDRGRIYASAIGMALCVPALIGLGYAWSIGAAIVFMVLFGLGWGFFDCNNMPILCQIAQPEHRATGYGFMNMVSISVGAGATVVLGWMRDEGISFSVAFALCAVVSAISAAAVLFIRPKDMGERAAVSADRRS